MTILTNKQTVSQPPPDMEQVAPDIIDISWIGKVLLVAAERAQQHYLFETGVSYSIEELFNCFISWLDSCLDELTTYAFELCVQDSLRRFNWEAFQMAFLRIKPTEDIQQQQEQTMIQIEVSDNDYDLKAQFSQAKVGVIVHHLQKIRREVNLIDLLDAFEVLVSMEKDKATIPRANLDYALDCLTDAEMAIRNPQDWLPPRNWPPVCSCQKNGYDLDNLPY